MWQIICLCLPAVTLSERQRFFALFKDVLKSFGREPGEMDLSLFFLYGLSPEESLTVLEERLRLVERSQALLAQPGAPELPPDGMQLLIADHMRTLLACIGYLVHPFVKETTCAFTILLFWIRYPNT